MRLLTTVLLAAFAATSYAHTPCAPKAERYTYTPAGYSCPRVNYHEAAFYRCKKCYYPRDYRACKVNSCHKRRSFNRFDAHSWVTPLSVEHYCK